MATKKQVPVKGIPLGATKQAILHYLQDGEFHDGDSIGKSLHITRAGVWKIIKKLQEYGVPIESIKNKGYRLLEPMRLLEKSKIDCPGIELTLFESISSTNDYLKENKKDGIAVCLAEQMTCGRGRLQRGWYAPFGKNIYLSCLYPFHKDISEMAGLSLVVGLSIVKTLNSYSSDKPFMVKWPNDVLYEGKKISGTLIELSAESHDVCAAVIGIGINVNMLEDEGHITQKWTSLKRITGNDIDRNEVCTRLLNNLFEYLKEFAAEGFAAFQSEWKKADALLHSKINLLHAENGIQGEVLGVNKYGHLLLVHSDGSERAYSSGDTTICKTQN